MSVSVSRSAARAFPPLAIALAVSSIFSTPALAQAAHPESLEAVVVTASRTPQKAGEVLADHIVITAEEIRESGQTSLADLLQTKRSIEIKRNGGPGTDTEVYIRGGNGKQTLLLIDGVRSVSSTSGTAMWSAVPLSQIERVEIVMGPLSSLYGADAVGGVIQVFTKKGHGAPQLTFSAGAGSDGEQAYSAGISGSTEGDHRVRYSLNASHEKADGFSVRPARVVNPSTGSVTSYDPDKDGYTKRSLNGQVSWELAQGHEIGAMFLNSYNRADIDNSGIPVFKPYMVNEVDVYSAYSRNRLSDNWISLFQVSRSYTRQQSFSSATPGVNNSKQDNFSWQNDISIGKDLLQVLLERREESVFNTAQALQNRSRNNNSIAFAYQANRGNHQGSASVRYDDSSVYGSKVTGGLGYGYRFDQNWRVNGSVATSFRAPTYNDLYYAYSGNPTYGNPDAKPEKGKNAEIGVHYDNGRTHFSAVYYRNALTDMLAAEPCANGAPGQCTYNVDRALLTGVSLEAGSRFGSYRLFGSLDIQDPRDETTDTLIARRAKYHGTVGFSHTAGAIKSGADIVFSGYRYDQSEHKDRLGGYALLNLHASYDLNDDWQLFGRWNNALDKKYEFARGYQTQGSNVFVGIRYGFK
ncbi:TonB-dependent receptor plug domain-containing protein [Oxalicibacterium flavum]|uniref:TonB-dependent receptor plug domain-containing protein n=1 Tax=Oxalicibacterium flavum TaxID=179467 RepID=UPI00166EFA6C|nr:TonB-dependent receptor [Oxalicibacterium flavum]